MTSVKHPHCYVCGTPIYKADGLGKWPDGRTYHALCQVGIHTKVVGKHRTTNKEHKNKRRKKVGVPTGPGKGTTEGFKCTSASPPPYPRS